MQIIKQHKDICSIRYFFPKKFSGGWRIITIYENGQVLNDKICSLDEFSTDWKNWKDCIKTKDIHRFDRPQWLLLQKERETAILNLILTGGYVFLCCFVTLNNSLQSMQLPVIVFLASFVILGPLVQFMRRYSNNVTQIMLERDTLTVSCINGKICEYGISQIRKQVGGSDMPLSTVEFDDGFKIRNLLEFSYAPILIEKLKEGNC